MSQVEAVKESANNNTSSISKKNGYHHRKKGESWNTAAAMRSLTYYNNSLTAKWNAADEQLPGNKSKSRTYLLPQDVEVIVLQTNPKHRNLSLIQLIQITQNFGYDRWIQALFQEQMDKGNTAVGELKLVAYQPNFEEPEEPNFVGVTEGRRALLVQKVINQQQNFDKERVQLKLDRIKLITRILALLSPELRAQVESLFADYMINPNVIAVLHRVKSVYDLAHFEGRKEDLEQQVTQVMSQFFGGEVALSNLAENGVFDLAFHKRIFEQLLGYRTVAEFPDMDPIEQAKYLIFSCESIKYLRPCIENLKSNEYLYRKMPMATEEQRLAATTFRQMLQHLQDAYDLLASVKDIGVVFKEDLAVLSNRQQLGFQNSSICQSSAKVKSNKQNTKAKNSEDEVSIDPTKVCHICDKTDHSTLECTQLPAAILTLKAQEGRNNTNINNKNNNNTKHT